VLACPPGRVVFVVKVVPPQRIGVAFLAPIDVVS
jgi:hypothetical protein